MMIKHLIEQICTRILPRRGIYVEPGQILLTSGLQQSCVLLRELLLGGGRKLGMVLPPCPVTREIFQGEGACVVNMAQDADGPVVEGGGDIENAAAAATGGVTDIGSSTCELLFLQPNGHMPTGITTSLERRRRILQQVKQSEQIIIENDCDHDFYYHGSPLPPLKSMAGGERVIYLYEFPKAITAGFQLSFVVASKQVIKRLRALRYAKREQLPSINQRMLGNFIASGHFDASIYRITQSLRSRWEAVGEALMYHLPKYYVRRSVCGTACWLELPERVDAREVIKRAETLGILLELVETDTRHLRIGFAAIDQQKIEPGISALAALIKGELAAEEEVLSRATGMRLTAATLQSELSGAMLLGTNTLGESYRIQLLEDGTMLGYSRNDVDMDETDTGRWWLDGDRWVRRWRRWSYGRTASFHVVVEGHRIKWFGEQGQLVDTAILTRDS